MKKKIDNNILYVILEEKKIVFAGILLGMIAFIIYLIFFYVPLFKINSKIFVKNIKKVDIVADFNGGSSVNSESGYSNPLFNLYEVLKSENVSNGVYEAVKAKYPEDLARFNVNSKQDFYQVYQKIVSSDVEPSTDILQVSLLWPNSKNAPAVLKIVIDQFKKENLGLNKSIEINKRIFIDKQTEEISKNLDDIRAKIKDYRLKSNLTDLRDESANLVYARVDLERQSKILKSQAEYNQRKLETYAKQLNFPSVESALRSTGIGQDPYLVKLSQDLSVAQEQLARLKAKYTAKHPDVISMENDINKLKENIKGRKSETINSVKISRGIYDPPSAQVVTNMAVAQAEATSLQTQFATLVDGVKQMKAEEAKLPAKQMGYDDLKKKEDAFATAYQSIKEKQLEAKIKENEIVDNLLVLESSSRPLPLLTVLITKLIGFILTGGLCGFAFAYLKQSIENKWASTSEIELLTGETVLGSIPWIKDMTSKNAKVIIDAAYSNIASEIISKAYLNETFILSLISTTQSKNKSDMARILASKIAKLDASVLLIDLVNDEKNKTDIIDLIKEVNKNLRFNNYENEEDLNNYLNDILANYLPDIIRTIDIESISGEVKMSMIELHKSEISLNDYIATKGFSYLLKRLSQKFEFILINAPHGFILLPEIQAIKQVSDAGILISSISTNRDTLMRFVDNYRRTQTKVLGIITREENSEFEKSFELLEEYTL